MAKPIIPPWQEAALAKKTALAQHQAAHIPAVLAEAEAAGYYLTQFNTWPENQQQALAHAVTNGDALTPAEVWQTAILFVNNRGQTYSTHRAYWRYQRDQLAALWAWREALPTDEPLAQLLPLDNDLPALPDTDTVTGDTPELLAWRVWWANGLVLAAAAQGEFMPDSENSGSKVSETLRRQLAALGLRSTLGMQPKQQFTGENIRSLISKGNYAHFKYFAHCFQCHAQERKPTPPHEFEENRFGKAPSLEGVQPQPAPINPATYIPEEKVPPSSGLPPRDPSTSLVMTKPGNHIPHQPKQKPLKSRQPQPPRLQPAAVVPAKASPPQPSREIPTGASGVSSQTITLLEQKSIPHAKLDILDQTRTEEIIKLIREHKLKHRLITETGIVTPYQLKSLLSGGSPQVDLYQLLELVRGMAREHAMKERLNEVIIQLINKLEFTPHYALLKMCDITHHRLTTLKKRDPAGFSLEELHSIIKILNELSEKEKILREKLDILCDDLKKLQMFTIQYLITTSGIHIDDRILYKMRKGEPLLLTQISPEKLEAMGTAVKQLLALELEIQVILEDIQYMMLDNNTPALRQASTALGVPIYTLSKIRNGEPLADPNIDSLKQVQAYYAEYAQTHEKPENDPSQYPALDE